MVHESVISCIGNTPLVRMRRLTRYLILLDRIEVPTPIS